MGWPWHFVDLNDHEREVRRQLLDRYGVYAQLSALVPVLIYYICHLAGWISLERKIVKSEYSAIPSSPSLKIQRRSGAGSFAIKLRQARWWLGTPLLLGWGTRGLWICGVVWTIWLSFLSVNQTGDDYMHVTKRFGIVAASQLPMHYMLSMKNRFSPFALAFHASHEELNPYHRTLGKIIYAFFVVHGAFYINFFVQLDILWMKLTTWYITLGAIALLLFTILISTALDPIRTWSYRVFFVCHLIIGVTILPILFFHVTHIRIYVVEALVLFVLDIIIRKLDTFTAFTKITTVPHTKLVKLSIPMSGAKLSRFREAAGQHVYVNIPSESAKNPIHQLLYNPFTVAEVHEKSITLVMRVLKGPTTQAIERLTRLPKAHPPINIEGPYGSASTFPNLATKFDRVLLVAGGVGSTFIFPVYQQLELALASDGLSSRKVELVWTMKTKDEASWITTTEAEGWLDADDNIKLFTTKGATQSVMEDGSVEMTNECENSVKRPDLRKVVDDIFKHGEEERVAILVCGPKGIAEEVRAHVGLWVMKGRDVWFHDEGFGW